MRNPTRTFHQWHKWLAVAVLLPTLGWFISGVAMAVPHTWWGRGDLESWSPDRAAGPADPTAADIQVTVPAAIAALRQARATTEPVGSVSVRRFPGRIAYLIEIGGDAHLVDAITAEPFTVDAQLATRIMAPAVGADRIGAISLRREPVRNYFGPLPVHEIRIEDRVRTVVFVAVATGQVHTSDAIYEAVELLGTVHDFRILNALVPASLGTGALVTASVVGLAMAVTGTIILVLQVQAWRRRRSNR